MDKLSKTKVLIVEDEPDIAGLMKHALQRGGELDVEMVSTGAAALKSVMEEPPGLILLDVNLPFIDGAGSMPPAKRTQIERHYPHHHGDGADRRDRSRQRTRFRRG